MQNAQLETLASQAALTNDQYRNTVEALFAEGVRALKKSQDSGFEDKASLLQSLETFHRMIPHAQDDARPYLFIGYTLYLMDQNDEAERYLKQAALLNPDQAEVPTLMQLIARSREQVVFKTWDPSRPRREQTLDADRLFDELEGFVQGQMRKLMELPRPGQKLYEGATLDKVRAMLGRLDDFLQTSAEASEILKETFASVDIDDLMAPLTSHAAQLRAHFEISQRAADLKSRLGAATETVSKMGRQVRQIRTSTELSQFNAALSQFFDACDIYADQLDGLSAQGFDITNLEKSYERLVKFADQIQSDFSERQIKLSA